MSLENGFENPIIYFIGEFANEDRAKQMENWMKQL
jgi:hypothetical protein